MKQKATFLSLGILLAVGFLLFGRSLSFDYVAYDDYAFVRDNPYVNKGLSLEGLRWAFLYDSQPGSLSHPGVENLWHPLTWLSFMLDIELFGGDHPQGLHLINVLLYLLTIPLVYASSSIILKKVHGHYLAPFLFTLLWMVHPLKAESVAWISERKDLLSGFFFWGALVLALLSLGRNPKWRWVGLGFFISALLSKPSVVIMPALLILLSGYLKQETKWNLSFFMQELKTWWSWFFASFLVFVVTYALQSTGSQQLAMEHSSLLNRLRDAPSGFWFYISRILVPLNLNFFYEQPSLNWFQLILSWGGLLTLTIVTWLKRGIWRTWFMGYCWFLICWLPTAGLVYVGASFTADRYLYHALAGFLFPLVICLSQYSWSSPVLIALSIAWSFLCFRQVGVWQNSETLFSHSIKARPKAGIGWSNLATLYERQGKETEAIQAYQQALSLNAADYITYSNLGKIYKAQNQIEKATDSFQRCLKINPNHLPAAYHLGLLKKEAGDWETARELFSVGGSENIRMMWLALECEMKLGNHQAASQLVQSLESLKRVPTPAERKALFEIKKSLEKNGGK